MEKQENNDLYGNKTLKKDNKIKYILSFVELEYSD